MRPSIMEDTKRRGRPAGRTYSSSIPVRLTPAQLEGFDAWREAQPDKPSRSEAIRRLVEEALRTKCS